MKTKRPPRQPKPADPASDSRRRYWRCKFSRFESIPVIDKVSRCGIVVPYEACSWMPEAAPPPILAKWRGEIVPERDCLLCLCFEPRDPPKPRVRKPKAVKTEPQSA